MSDQTTVALVKRAQAVAPVLSDEDQRKVRYCCGELLWPATSSFGRPFGTDGIDQTLKALIRRGEQCASPQVP